MKRNIFILIFVLVLVFVVVALSRSGESGDDTIRVSSPTFNQIIKSPLMISGEARGSWYFEASFPILLVDASDNVIAQGIATAEKNWMTNDLVPFKATLQFENSTAINGTLIFKKDNPSGLPENDASIRVPVRFPPVSVVNLPQYNIPFTLRVGETATLPEGMSVKLEKIDDSRCPANVQCIWQGELGATFILTGGGFASSTSIRLGTERNKSIIPASSGLTFTLQSATLESATLVISN